MALPIYSMANGLIQQVNPNRPAKLRISGGIQGTAPDGTPVPLYATPTDFVASIAGTVMTVSAVSAGVLQSGQTVVAAGVDPATTIVAPIEANPDGTGTYTVSIEQSVASEAMASDMLAMAQIQDLSQKDVRIFEGLNLQPSNKVIFVSGFLNGVVRFSQKGGDLIEADGETYLTTAVLEQWPTWCKVTATLQNGQ